MSTHKCKSDDIGLVGRRRGGSSGQARTPAENVLQFPCADISGLAIKRGRWPGGRRWAADRIPPPSDIPTRRKRVSIAGQ